MDKNQVGSIIDVQELQNGRDLDVRELLSYFQMHKSLFWSWGARDFQNGYDRFMRMTVSGHHPKGHVYIRVNGLDLFDVYLTSNRGTIKHVINDVYIEDLFEILDNRIEKIDKYRV